MEMQKTTTYSETVTSQPKSQTFQVITWEKTRPWTTGLFNCMHEGCGKCLKSTFCNWCIFCDVAKEASEHCCATWWPGSASSLRTKIRLMYGIEGNTMRDCVDITCWGPCAVCQMDREVRTVKGELKYIVRS